MKILAIDTSCDETSAAVTEGTKILSNVIWSQASEHTKFGGVMPSLAQRMHEERIGWVVKKALGKHKIGAVAVTAGPGLAIALGVGIKKAIELAKELRVPLIEVNHIEGHLLSPLAGKGFLHFGRNDKGIMGLVVSGGHTELVYIEEIGKYKIIAKTQDDALGEALDKAARMLGLGYPGGAILEKMAREGDPKAYPLPLPMAGREDQNSFSYSGLKAAMWRLTNELRGGPSASSGLSARQIADLASAFQEMAFKHLTRVMDRTVHSSEFVVGDLLVGGGVAANVNLRKKLRSLGKELGIKVWFPKDKKLYGDNAAMIGIAAYYKYNRGEYLSGNLVDKADRKPRWRIDEE